MRFVVPWLRHEGRCFRFVFRSHRCNIAIAFSECHIIASLKAQISFLVWRLGCASHAMRHLLSLLKRTRHHELVGECKLASLWHAKLKPPTACIIIISYIASLKAQISFLVWRLGCASHAVHHLLGLLERTRRHELVGRCKLASLWHAKLKPPCDVGQESLLVC
jgi:hypothetical protein